MSDRPHDWIPASKGAAAFVRLVIGPTAAFGYSPGLAGRDPTGRRYYVHISDEIMPIRSRYYSGQEIEHLLHQHGDGLDAAIATDLLKWDLAED